MAKIKTKKVTLQSPAQVTVKDALYDIQNKITWTNTRIDNEITTRDSLLYLAVQRMKQLEVTNKAISLQYTGLVKHLSGFTEIIDLLKKTAEATQIINGFTIAEINEMSSEQYLEKVLKPLGVRDERSSKAA